MEKINYSLVAKATKSEMVEVFVKCEQYGRNVQLPTNVKIFKGEWNKDTGMIVHNENAQKLNKYLRKTVYDIESLEFSSEDGITINKLNQIWKHRKIMADFYEIVENDLPNRSIRPTTLKNHRLGIDMIREYSPKCAINDLTEDFVKGFYHFLKTKRKRNGGRLSDSTVNKYMEIFKTYYNLARKLFGDKVPDWSFRWYKYKEEKKPFKAISDDDIRTLENYAALTNNKVVDQFLFMSYTGMRISDFISLKEENVHVSEGKMWIEYTSIKTNTFVKLPISSLFNGRAEQIIYKYFNRLNIFFCTGDNSCWNRKINTQAMKAGLNKHLSAHMARHTFACRLLDKGVALTTIQKVIGHNRLKTTLGYAKISDDSLVRQLCVS